LRQRIKVRGNAFGTTHKEPFRSRTSAAGKHPSPPVQVRRSCCGMRRGLARRENVATIPQCSVGRRLRNGSTPNAAMPLQHLFPFGKRASAGQTQLGIRR